VLAHEIAHHVQKVTGAEGRLRAEQRESRDSENEPSIRMELQADCLSGVWAHSTYEEQATGQVNPGELDARLLRAAHALVPGRLRQRDPERCDTFSRDV
jgi:hypothetical protein